MEPDESRVANELQAMLVELIDLTLTAKQAHWNVTGPNFRPLHLHLDELTDELREWTDLVAERIVTIGGAADGRVDTVASNTPLPAFPTGLVEDGKVVAAVLERLDKVIDTIRPRVVRIGATELVSHDLLVSVVAGLEKHQWMFRAQRH